MKRKQRPGRRAAGGSPGRERARAAAAGLRPRFALMCTVYCLLVVGLSVLFLSDFVFDDLLGGLRLLVAKSAAQTLSLAGVPVASRGEVITGPGASLLIVNECTGIDAAILLVCAILVFPAGWRPKLIGAALALGVMLTLNFVRVLSLVYVGTYRPDWLEISHLYVWPAGVILAAVGTLLFWADRFALPRPS